MARLFTAIELPGDVVETLLAATPSIPGCKKSSTDQLHITLNFLSNVPEERLGALADCLGTIQCEPITIELKGVGRFPQTGITQILWAKVEDNVYLNALQAQIEETLALNSFTFDMKKFIPHITLGRFPQPPQIKAVEDYLKKQKSFSCEPFTISTFTLFSSILTQAGATHKRERKFCLNESHSEAMEDDCPTIRMY